MTSGHLPPETVLDIASHLGLDDGAFIIGGQALNLWAEFFSRADELDQYRPYTSKDVDYFGFREAAEKLADALGGRVSEPDLDNHTPQTAIVEAEIDGELLIIDFLDAVLGVKTGALQRGVTEIVVPARRKGVSGEIAIPVMHPLHCLQSRIANLVKLRTTDGARRQAEAAPVILREYIAYQLASGEEREAIDTLQELFAYLTRDPNGRRAHLLIDRDPLEALEAFVDDDRLDSRYREKSLKPAVEKIRAKRKAIGPRILAALGLRGKHEAAGR